MGIMKMPVRDVLVTAIGPGKFLRAELERLAARPSMEAWLQKVHNRKLARQTRLFSEQILGASSAGRR